MPLHPFRAVVMTTGTFTVCFGKMRQGSPISFPQPEGFHYIPDFLSPTEEHEVLQRIEGWSLEAVQMHVSLRSGGCCTLAGWTGMSLDNCDRTTGS
jgi:hypothetical protein